MSYTVEDIAGPHILGEGPFWDDQRQVLYYVDSLKSSIIRYVPGEKKIYECVVGENNPTVSIIIPIKGKPDKFLVTIAAQLAEVTWDGISSTPQNVRILNQVDRTPDKIGNRFNDGKIDPTGRLWVGTMGKLQENWQEGVGTLYSFDKDLKETKKAENITIANGLAWSPDLKSMYYIDTPTKRVDVFDFEAKTGAISNRRPVFDFSTLPEVESYGGPDGMTIDTDGNLWVAVFGGSGVYNVNPTTGKLIRRIELPCPQITSVVFGGTNLDELYVVSATFMELGTFPQAGHTFKITGLGVKGVPSLPIEL